MNEPEAPRVVIEESADFVCTPAAGPLTGDALDRAIKARDRRAHLQALEAMRAHDHGWPEDPDLTFWKQHDHE